MILQFGVPWSGVAGAQVAPPPAVHDSPRESTASRSACFSAGQTSELLAAASSLLEHNRFGDAAALLQSKAQGRCDFRSDLLLAAAFDGQGDSVAAERTLRQALLLWPSNTSLATSLARDELQSGNFAAARRAIAQCRPTQHTPQPELRIMAMVYLENQELARAAAVAQLAWRGDPSEENLLFMANLLQLQGRYMDVVSLLEKHRADYGNSPGFLVTIGESESDGKLYAAAERDLKQAIALAPDSYPAHYVLGNLLVATGDLPGGIGEYQKAITLSPRQPRTYCQLGRALEQKGDSDQARLYFQKAISVDAQYEPAYTEMGKLDLQGHQLQAAVDNLTRAIRINPSSQDAYFLLVQAYGRLGERDKARAVMQQWTAYKKAHPLMPVGSRTESPVAH